MQLMELKLQGTYSQIELKLIKASSFVSVPSKTRIAGNGIGPTVSVNPFSPLIAKSSSSDIGTGENAVKM